MSFAGSPIRLGIITDIQFADKPNQPLDPVPVACIEKHGKDHVPMRSYSQALVKTASAVSALNAANVSATIHLGDIIDGNDSIESTRADLASVLLTLSPLQTPLLHVLGNHCLSAGRSHLLHRLKLDNTYYVHDLSHKWRLIVLDTVDISVDHDDEQVRSIAQEYLDKHAGSPNALSCNGGLSSKQSAWLERTLQETRQNGMWAIVCAHIPLHLSTESVSSPHLVVWDADVVTGLVDRFSDVVKAYFCGHYHQGDYAFRNDIHYVTFKAMLDSQHEDGAWAIAELYDDGIQIQGHGEERSRRFALK